MRKTSGKLVQAVLLLLAVMFCWQTTKASAGVGVNLDVNIGAPPVVVAEPETVVLIPSSGVYFVPGFSFDVFFYNGYWWSPRGGHWYRASGYNGPWVSVGRRAVPRAVIHVPGDYRRVYASERHIPYGQWKHRGHGGGERGERREHGREHGEHGGRGEHGGHGGHGEHRGGGHGEHGGGGHDRH